MFPKVQYRWRKLQCLLSHWYFLFYHRLFNSTVKQQLSNPKSIPIVIISFNQLYHLKQLIDFLLDHGYERIVILDNHSSYPPLLNYFETLDSRVTLYRLEKNLGHLAFWQSPDIFKIYSKGYYVITDADIVPIETCPHSFVESLRQLLDEAYDRTKVGLSLKLDDLPATNPNKQAILNWESRFNKVTIHPLAYKAEIDTTFAIYRPKYRYRLKHFTKAWRTKFPLQARHGGWYLDVDNLTEEQRYYMRTANESASWRINEQGDLVNVQHKPLYHGN